MVRRSHPPEQPSEKISDSTFRKSLDHFLPELVKRAVFLGAGMLFMTEEGVRKVLGEINLPREAVNYIIKQSEKSKTEFFTIFQRELNRFLSRIDITRLSKEVLDGISVEMSATVTLRTKSESVEEMVKVEKFGTSTSKAPKKKAKKQ